jgi:hypothetical protein
VVTIVITQQLDSLKSEAVQVKLLAVVGEMVDGAGVAAWASHPHPTRNLRKK